MARNTYIVLFIILIFSVGVKYYYLDNFNLFRGNDERVYSTLAEKMSKDPLDYTTANTDFSLWGDLYRRPLFHHPPMYPLLLSIVVKIYGLDLNKMASINIIAHTITLVFVFLIAKELYDEKVALLACGFFALDPLGLILANRIWIEGNLMMWITASFYFFVIGRKNEDNYYLSGIFLGIAFLTKALAYPMVLLYLMLLEFKPKRTHIKAFLISLLIFSPWVIWNLRMGLNLFSIPYYAVSTGFIEAVSLPWYTSVLGLFAVNPVFLLSFLGLVYGAINGRLSNLELCSLAYILVFCFLIKIKLVYFFGIIVPFLIILASKYVIELEKNLARKVPNRYARLFENHFALFVLFAIITWHNFIISQELSKIYLLGMVGRLLTFGKFGRLI